MSVNWQNNDYYTAMKDYEKKTGHSVADQNRIDNPYGSHTFGGLLISQVLPNLLIGAGEKYSGTGLNGSSDKGSETDVNQSTSTLSDFTYCQKKYDKAKLKGNSKKMKKWALELEKIGQEHNNENGNPTIKNAFKSVSQELKNVINS